MATSKWRLRLTELSLAPIIRLVCNNTNCCCCCCCVCKSKYVERNSQNRRPRNSFFFLRTHLFCFFVIHYERTHSIYLGRPARFVTSGCRRHGPRVLGEINRWTHIWNVDVTATPRLKVIRVDPVSPHGPQTFSCILTKIWETIFDRWWTGRKRQGYLKMAETAATSFITHSSLFLTQCLSPSFLKRELPFFFPYFNDIREKTEKGNAQKRKGCGLFFLLVFVLSVQWGERKDDREGLWPDVVR